MNLQVNGRSLAASPSRFLPKVIDLDDGDATERVANGRLNRSRIAVKRQIELEWGILTWPDISAVLKSMSAVEFQFSYPDPMDGRYVTKTFYVGDRSAAVPLARGNDILWSGLKLTLTEC